MKDVRGKPVVLMVSDIVSTMNNELVRVKKHNVTVHAMATSIVSVNEAFINM